MHKINLKCIYFQKRNFFKINFFFKNIDSKSIKFEDVQCNHMLQIMIINHIMIPNQCLNQVDTFYYHANVFLP